MPVYDGMGTTREVCKRFDAMKNIGKEVILNPRPVEAPRQKIIEQVGVKNTAGLVMFALENGIVE